MSLRRLYILAVDIAADAGNEDDEYGRDAEQPYSQRTGNGYPAVSESNLCALAQLERGHGDESHNSRTYAAEDSRNNLVVLKLMKEHGYGQNDKERGQRRTQTGEHRALDLLELIAYEHANVDGEHARTALGYGYDVEKVFLAHPFLLVDHLRLYYRNHGVAAAQGEQAYLEKSLEAL